MALWEDLLMCYIKKKRYYLYVVEPIRELKSGIKTHTNTTPEDVV